MLISVRMVGAMRAAVLLCVLLSYAPVQNAARGSTNPGACSQASLFASSLAIAVLG